MRKSKLTELNEMVLKKLFRKKTGRPEYALTSKKTGRVLFWFGQKKPGPIQILKQERRIQFFKNFAIVKAHRRITPKGRIRIKRHIRRS